MAKFSKAHYVALAKTIKLTEESIKFGIETPWQALYELKGNLGNLFEKDNPKFDRTRFLEACEPEVKR